MRARALESPVAFDTTARAGSADAPVVPTAPTSRKPQLASPLSISLPSSERRERLRGLLAQANKRLVLTGETRAELARQAGARIGDYRLLGNVRSLPEKSFTPRAGREVARHAGHVFFRVDSEDRAPVGSRPAALSEDGRRIGTVTGVIKVTLRSMESGRALADDYRLETVNDFEAIRLALYRAPGDSTAELLQILENIRRDERVESADLEITDRKNSPR